MERLVNAGTPSWPPLSELTGTGSGWPAAAAGRLQVFQAEAAGVTVGRGLARTIRDTGTVVL